MWNVQTKLNYAFLCDFVMQCSRFMSIWSNSGIGAMHLNECKFNFNFNLNLKISHFFMLYLCTSYYSTKWKCNCVMIFYAYCLIRTHMHHTNYVCRTKEFNATTQQTQLHFNLIKFKRITDTVNVCYLTNLRSLNHILNSSDNIIASRAITAPSKKNMNMCHKIMQLSAFPVIHHK